MNKVGWKDLTKRAIGWDGSLWIAMIVLTLVAGAALSWIYWGDLHHSEDSLSSTIRNVALVIGGVIAVMLAVWRSRVAERQANAAQRQAETADRSLLNDGYQKAAEMLGSSVLAVRLGGIYALQGLAERYPAEYHVPVMKQLCSFVRHPSEVEGQPIVGSSEVQLGPVYGATTAQDFAAAGALEIKVIREDIQAAMDSITSCHTRNLQIEMLHDYWIDLHCADLRGVDLSNKDLSKTPEYDEAAPFDYAMIGTMHTNLRGVKLHYANLARTNLTRSDLSHASGLTQSILDNACADPRMPPRLGYTFDAETGKVLVWCGKPIDAAL